MAPLRDTIVWSSHTISIQDLKTSGYQFPLLVKVTMGYYGETDANSFYADNVFLLHGWAVQKRLMASNHEGKCISIPMDNKHRLWCARENVGKAKGGQRPLKVSVTAEDFLFHYHLPVEAELDIGDGEKMYGTSDDLCCHDFEGMVIKKVFNLKYLLYSNIDEDGRINEKEFEAIPSPMDLEFSVAEDLSSFPGSSLDHVIWNYKQQTLSLSFIQAPVSLQKIMLHKAMLNWGHDYQEIKDYIQKGKIYHSLNEESTKRCDYSKRTDSEGNWRHEYKNCPYDELSKREDYEKGFSGRCNLLKYTSELPTSLKPSGIIELENFHKFHNLRKTNSRFLKSASLEETASNLGVDSDDFPKAVPRPNNGGLGNNTQGHSVNWQRGSENDRTVKTVATKSETQLKPNVERECGFRKLSEVPDSVRGLNISEVGCCLKLLHLESYVETFQEHQLDGQLIEEFDIVDFQGLGMAGFEAKKFSKFIKGWRPNCGVSDSSI